MIKKIIAIINIIFILSSFQCATYADDLLEELLPEDVESIIETAVNSEDELNINSRIAVAYDRCTGEVIWGKDENKRTAMASTTKIMTVTIAVENGNLDDVVTISAKAAGTGGSRLGLKKDDKISLQDLLYGLMLRSGNDAAIAIAEHIGGSVEEFSNMMNEKAEELNLKDTHFVTPHGLDDPDHYTTAYELAKLTDYALNNETVRSIVATKYYTININGYPKSLVNTNELLNEIEGIYGVKTGFTNNAGRCLVTAVKRNDMDIITVVLQADTKKDRGRDSSKIIKYIYDNYKRIDVKEIVDNEFENWCLANKNRINVKKAKSSTLNVRREALKNDTIVIKRCEEYNIKVEIKAIFEFEAPIKKNTVIGKIKVTIGDKIVDITDIYIENKIEKKDTIDYFLECIKTFKKI